MLNLSEDANRILTSANVKTIFLYEIYHLGLEAEPTRWAGWDIDVVYDGNTYEGRSIKHSEITQGSDGKINDINLAVNNCGRAVQQLIVDYGLIGKTIKVKQIFSGADDIIEYSLVIKGAATKKDQVVFQLGVGFDALKLIIPARKMFSQSCSWIFKGDECLYDGSETTCEKTFMDCKRKGNQERFGGFPAIINERLYF